MKTNRNIDMETFRGSREKLSKEIGGMVSEASDLLKNFSGENL
jgi:hypothetical protein